MKYSKFGTDVNLTDDLALFLGPFYFASPIKPAKVSIFVDMKELMKLQKIRKERSILQLTISYSQKMVISWASVLRQQSPFTSDIDLADESSLYFTSVLFPNWGGRE